MSDLNYSLIVRGSKTTPPDGWKWCPRCGDWLIVQAEASCANCAQPAAHEAFASKLIELRAWLREGNTFQSQVPWHIGRRVLAKIDAIGAFANPKYWYGVSA